MRRNTRRNLLFLIMRAAQCIKTLSLAAMLTLGASLS